MTFEELLLRRVSVITQATSAYSNSTMETPEKCVKSVQSLQKRYQSNVRRRSVGFIVYLWTDITHCSHAVKELFVGYGQLDAWRFTWEKFFIKGYQMTIWNFFKAILILSHSVVLFLTHSQDRDNFWQQ